MRFYRLPNSSISFGIGDFSCILVTRRKYSGRRVLVYRPSRLPF